MHEAVRQRFEFTGYLDQRVRLARDHTTAQDILVGTGVGDAPFVLCLVGGGEDGMALAENFARAGLPQGMHGVALTGPYMPASARRALHDLAASRPSFHVLDFASFATA